MTSVVVLILFGLLFAVTAGLGSKVFYFENGLILNQTCGAGQNKAWTLDGSVRLTTGDTVVYQPKVEVNTVQELCTVDLSRCPPDPLPTSPQACYCKSSTNNRYHIHVALTTMASQAGKTLKAVIQGPGVFHHIYAASSIGKLPSRTEHKPRVNASYTIDVGVDRAVEREVLDNQTIRICPDKGSFVLTICTVNEHPKADLRLTVDKKTTKVTGGKCLATSHKFTSGNAAAMTFEYSDSETCTQRSLFHFKEDIYACYNPIPTTSTVTVEGECPYTPHIVTTLPELNGIQVLQDNITMDGTWTVIQRRVLDDVDFYRPWDHYVSGFGNLTNSFWLGLDKIYQLCNVHQQCELLIHIKHLGSPAKKYIKYRADLCYHSHWRYFWLAGPDDNYRLHLSHYTGNAGNKMGFNDNQQFSTWDRDNDEDRTKNCAEYSHGAWWYPEYCGSSNLNGRSSTGGNEIIGAYWDALTGRMRSVWKAEMSARRH